MPPTICQRPSERVLAAVSAHTGVPVAAILGSSRKAPIVWARHLSMALLRHAHGWSSPRIGRALGRDHTTVLHACDRLAATGALPGLARAALHPESVGMPPAPSPSGRSSCAKRAG